MTRVDISNARVIARRQESWSCFELRRYDIKPSRPLGRTGHSVALDRTGPVHACVAIYGQHVKIESTPVRSEPNRTALA